MPCGYVCLRCPFPDCVLDARAIELTMLDIPPATTSFRAIQKEEARAYNKAYRESHKEEISGRQKQWYLKNKKQVTEQHKAYREAHKEESKAKRKARSPEKKAQDAAYQKAYREANREELNAKQRARRQKKKEEAAHEKP